MKVKAETVHLNIDRDRLDRLAEEIFMEISGMNRDGRKFQRMKNDALEILTRIRPSIKPVAAYRRFSQVVLEDRSLEIEGTQVSCAAFQQIDGEAVKGAYVYAVSAGNYTIIDDDIMSRLYSDFWGNAYTDAARQLLEEELGCKASLSSSFGPGFYGMETSELEKFRDLMDFEELGIEVRDGKVMIPQKSCTGLYLEADRGIISDSCSSCMGSHQSCSLCMVNRSRQNV